MYRANRNYIQMQENNHGTPTPFDQPRAQDIKDAACKAVEASPANGLIHWVDKIRSVATPGEVAYIHAVWAAIPEGTSSFADAFFSILNGNIHE